MELRTPETFLNNNKKTFKALSVSEKQTALFNTTYWGGGLYNDSLPTDNALARWTRPILDQFGKLAIISVNPKPIWQAVPDSGSFVSKGV